MFVIAGFLFGKPAYSQSIPIEIFAGDKKSTLDIMFFKFIKTKEKTNSPFLFFNRNRVGVDYKMTETTNLPQFGFTEAISYNSPKLKGFAPVGVVSILNKVVSPKIGVQYAKIQKDFTIFSWAVTETLPNPNIDVFILARYTPKMSEQMHLYTQVELFNSFPTFEQNAFSFVQRLRLGLKVNEFQFGVGFDFTESGTINLIHTNNSGGFIRYEF